jgi:hypothetical protein
MDINELQSFKLSDAVKFHDELNPKLWTVDDKLLPEVQEQLEKIAEDFLMSLGISDLKVKDITISGSNAAYSYTPHSDLDLHILVDFNELPDDEVYKELFNAKKTVYNDTHDIKINDIPVELYVQDTNQKHASLGEYSIKNKDWVKFPIKRRANLDQKETRLKYEKLGNLVELAIKLKDVERINQVLSTLKRYRRAGLDKTGEFGPENLAYKLIRTQGLFQALIDTKNEIHSKNLSLPENNVLEVIDLPKKNYQVINNRYHTGEVHFTTKTGNEYTVGFRPDAYIDRPVIAKHYPKFIDKYTSGKEVYFDIKNGYDRLLKGQQQAVPLTGTGDEFEVFSTVSDVIHHYLRTKKPVYLVFAADEKRESLYRKIAKKISQDFDTFKLIKIPYKKSADIYIVYNTEYTSDDVYEAIDLKNLVSDPTKLKTYDTHISPKEAYDRLLKGDKDPVLLKAVAKSAEYAYEYARYVLGGPFILGEPTIAKSAKYTYWYARFILKKPFPLGEPAIAKQSYSAYYYAKKVLKGPFPLGEPAIAENADTAFEYAKLVLKRPFLLGEPAIATDDFWKEKYEDQVLKGRPWTGLDQKVDEAIDLKNLVTHPTKLKTYDTHISPQEAYDRVWRVTNGEPDEYLIRAVAKSTKYSYRYAKDLLKGPFPLGEPAIAKYPTYAYFYAYEILKGPFPLGEPEIAKDPEYAYLYAKNILKGPFPLAEPEILKHPKYAYLYAAYALKSPFPLGEPAIATDNYWKHRYQDEVLKGRPWTGLDQKVDEAIDLKKLVSDPKKLKTYDTHISPEEAYTRLYNGDKDPVLVKAVAKDPREAYYYATDVLQGLFPLGEPAIATRALYALWYAEDILKGPFPLGEPEIAKDPDSAYQYARSILKKPFPLGEPAIATHDFWKEKYEKRVLKGRPWTGLDQKVDEAIDLKKLVTHPKKLKTYKTHISPEEAYNRLTKGEKAEYLIHAVSSTPESAYYYAVEALKGPFPLGEPAIAKDTRCSYWYASEALKGPFPLGEPAIAKSPEYAYLYARDVLKGPFPLGEPEIAKTAGRAYSYAIEVLKGPFPLGEPAIAKDPEWAYEYASDILKGPFPLGEPTIAKHPYVSLGYARNVLKGPFPLAEPVIMQYSNVAEAYENYILKGKPWTGLDQKVDEAIDLKKLVTDPKKLKTYDTHISPSEAYDRLMNGDKDPISLKVVAKNSNYAFLYARNVLKGPFPLGEPIIAKDPEYAYCYASYVLNGPFKLGEPAIAKDSDYSYWYARDVLKGPFPLGEPAIAKDGDFAYYYALDILKGPFKLGEPAIAKYSYDAYQYAKNILKGPFKLGEPIIAKSRRYSNLYKRLLTKFRNKKKTTEAIDLKRLVTHPKKLKTYDTHISAEEAYDRLLEGDKDPILLKVVAKDSGYACLYARDVLKGPFLIGEPAIAKDSWSAYGYAQYALQGPFKLGEPAIAKDSDYSYYYAKNVLKGPFKLGEPAIAEDAKYSYQYARDVLEKPFPLGELAIAKDPRYLYWYAKGVLKGTPWTGVEKKKKTIEAIDLKNLVSDPTKLKTYDTHISSREAYDRLRYGDKDPVLVKAVAKDPIWATSYAVEILKGPFPLGEPAIAKDADCSFDYARLLNRPWPPGEPAIAKSPLTSRLYAEYILKGPFPLGEPAIATSPYNSFRYAAQALGERFKLGEPGIATRAGWSYQYARDILKGPFPLGEPAIYNNSDSKDKYEKEILKGRPWTGLDQKVDEAMDLKKLVSDPTKLKTYDTHIGPEEAYYRLLGGDKDPVLVKVVAKSPEYAYLYAKNILKGPFPLGEPIIAKRPGYAFYYAYDILKGPFPLGEPVIAKDPGYSYIYAKHIMKGPWPLCEPAISTNDYWKQRYQELVLKGRPWTGLDQKVDEAIDLKSLVSDPTKLKTHDTHISPHDALVKLRDGETDEYLVRAVAKSAQCSYDYAILVLRKPFPLGEPAIAKDSAFAYLYSRYVLEGPFPLGEPAIAENHHYADRYKKFVLDIAGKSWTGLKKKKKTTEAMDLKKLVSDPKKLKTYDTHIGPKEAYTRLENGDKDPILLKVVAKDPRYALGYADQVLGGPFPLGEPAIAKHPMYAYYYAKYALKGPFPLGEPTIYNDEYWRYHYIHNVLKEKPWTGLDQKVDEANIQESASGYIPSKKEANDPRYSMALTVDIKPDTMQQNAKKLGWKISRKGTPPLLMKPKT